MNKNIIIPLNVWFLICCFVTVTQAQFRNYGADIQIKNGAFIIAQTKVQNSTNGQITNEGKIFTTDDFVNDNASTLTGGVNAEFEVQKNWLNYGTYNHVGSKVTFSGNEDSQLIAGSHPFFQMNINKSFSKNVLLNSDAVIEKSLLFANDNNKLELHSFNLEVDEQANIISPDEDDYIVTNGTGYLILQAGHFDAGQTYTLPIGYNHYHPISISQNNSTSYDLKVRYLPALYDMGGTGTAMNDVVDGSWEIVETNSNTNLDISLQWNQIDELGNFDRTNCNIVHWNGNNWEAVNSAGNVSGTDPYIASANNLSNTGYFGLMNRSALPLELLTFQAKASNNIDALLFWETIQEKGVSHFELERSKDGKNWKKVAKIDTKIGTTQAKSYQYIDKGVHHLSIPQTFYYRLKILDEDGFYTYSPITTLAFKANNVTDNITVYPNPSQLGVYIAFSEQAITESLNIQLTDVLGRVLHKETFKDIITPHYFTYPLLLPSGTYWLHLKTKDGMWERIQLSILKK